MFIVMGRKHIIEHIVGLPIAEENKEPIHEHETMIGEPSLSIDASRFVNFVNWQAENFEKIKTASAKQNHFSFLRSVSIKNDGAEDIFGAKLVISFLPDCIKCEDVFISCLEKGKTTVADSFSISLDPKYLYELSEVMPGSIHFALVDKNGNVLAVKDHQLELMPIEESASEDRVDEILVSFVTPNDDQVRIMASKAAKKLEEKYHRSAFFGYQAGDPDKIIEELDSIYLAIKEEGIHYSNPPASFEKIFQRIRLPRTVLLEKTGTCVDFAILFASVMENVGLNPLIIVINGHAFNGCWLFDDHFPNGLVDNSTIVLNNSSTGFDKIYLLNSVDSAAGNPAVFPQSHENGYHDLEEADPFLYALDVTRCRQENIRPIPTPHNVDGKIVIDYDFETDETYTNEHIDDSNKGFVENGPSKEKNKFDIWEEKLLDLNMRNNLINLRLGGSNCQILCADAPKLFDQLKKQNTYNLYPNQTERVEGQRFIAFESVKSDSKDLVDALNNNSFYVVSANGMPERNLVNLSRKANTEIEESGCNPLFLTIGAIRWFDNDRAAEVGKASFCSPILLIPVSLPRRRNGPYFRLEVDMDGIQFNTTLFEYFKQNLKLNFSEFDNLFENRDTDINLQKIYNTIRSRISNQKGWSVLDNFVCVSIFSFAHFVMWSDMKNYREIFFKNPIVASLVNSRKEWQDPTDCLKPEMIDSKLVPTDLVAPLSADSSQILAIDASARGESFVLDGPPGTGKSQTIANMIVNSMFHRKTVLFVAEKEVALNVVKNRLDKLGLGNFCLQISSAKANKKDVLSQLSNALKIGRTSNPESFQKEAEVLKNKRDILNATLQSLHQAKGFFVSIYEAIVSFLQVESFGSLKNIDNQYAKSLTKEKYDESIKSLQVLATCGQTVGSYHHNPFVFFQSRNYDIVIRDSIFQELIPFAKLVNQYNDDSAGLFYSQFSEITQSKKNLDILERAFSILRDDNGIFTKKLADDEFFSKKKAIIDYLTLSKARANTRATLSLSLVQGVNELDSSKLSSEYGDANKTSLLKRWKILFGIKKELKPYAVSKAAIRIKALKPLIDCLVEADRLKEILAKTDSFVRFVFPKEEEKDVEKINEDIKNTIRTNELRELIAGLELKFGINQRQIFDTFVSLSSDASWVFSNKVSSFINSKQNLDAANSKLKLKYEFDFYADEDEDTYVSNHLLSLQKAVDSKGQLSAWVTFLNALDSASSNLPKTFVTDYRSGKIKETDLVNTYQASLFYQIVSAGLAEEKLSNLSATNTDQEIVYYKEQIGKFNELTICETAARITANYRSLENDSASSTTFYKLNHLCANGGRGKSLRGIFEEFGELIHNTCPCFLMSPLAVSQYLEPGKSLFDTVIFDEASQIQTSEAIGSLARGRNVVVAGDQKQMPPTNFFSASLNIGDDDENDDVIAYDDLESFLDDCIAMNLPRFRLNCHYRSNHESLIAFSNNRFYNNSLLTFPSPTNQISKVSFRYISGEYQKGIGVNRDEAKAIVDEVLRRLQDKELSKMSIGIITFNEKQQNLILDLLDKEVYSNSSLNATPGGETIFVKNLENVQGDERDVILFSICFGPDPKTKIMVLNFGPLSRENGERRLNVAVSRSRVEMVVFSSTQPEEIRAEQAKNKGADYLRSFLRFAKYGISSLSNSVNDHIFVSEKSVADFLAADLRELGYQVDTNVGSSSFRVDIGIKDPDNPSNYLMGVICDSRTYSSSPTCQDRNVVQPSMLSRLHWKILHVWSVEYFDHKDIVIKHIVEALNEPKTKNTEIMSEAETRPIEGSVIFQKREIPDKEKYPSKREYVHFVSKDARSDDIVANIVNTEWPISRTMLEKRYREGMNVGRVGNQIKAFLDNKLRQFYRESYSNGETYYWPSKEDAISYSIYRVNSDRNLTDLPYQELAAAAKDIVSFQGAMTADDLLKQISLLFGLSALKEKTRNHLNYCLKRMLSSENAFFSMNENVVSLSPGIVSK